MAKIFVYLAFFCSYFIINIFISLFSAIFFLQNNNKTIKYEVVKKNTFKFFYFFCWPKSFYCCTQQFFNANSKHHKSTRVANFRTLSCFHRLYSCKYQLFCIFDLFNFFCSSSYLNYIYIYMMWQLKVYEAFTKISIRVKISQVYWKMNELETI